MKIHSDRKIRRVKELRRVGLSIHEIMDELNMPKTTVWHHIHNVPVLPEYQKQLKSKRGGGEKRKQKNEKLAKEKAIELLSGPKKHAVVALTMLYWAEGSKGAPEFVNSDGNMIRLYLKYLQRDLKISHERIHVTIRIFTGMDRGKCLRYWSEITDISSKDFIVRFNDGGTSGRTQYGMCRISVRKGGAFLKLMNALISEVYKKEIKM